MLIGTCNPMLCPFDLFRPSKLKPQVQDLMKLIFDTQAMERTMAELEIDTQKMPLGRLSKAELEKVILAWSRFS